MDYDANGNVRSETTNGQTLTFNTDYEDKPLSITGVTPAGTSVNDTYAYNGLGMRQTGPGLNPLTDGQTPGSPILVNGNITYTPGISQNSSASGSLFYLTDGRDQLRARYNSSNTLEDDIRYNPWGDQIFHGGNAPTGLTQGWGIDAAYQQDGDTDLTLMGNRYYDPTIGRFLSVDHAKSGNNWYAYCGNNPLTHSDPTGQVDTAPTVASAGFGGGGDWYSGQIAADDPEADDFLGGLKSQQDAVMSQSGPAVGQASFDFYNGTYFDPGMGGDPVGGYTPPSTGVTTEDDNFWIQYNAPLLDFDFDSADWYDIGTSWNTSGNDEMVIGGIGGVANSQWNYNWQPGSSPVGARNLLFGRLFWVIGAGGGITKGLGVIAQSASHP